LHADQNWRQRIDPYFEDMLPEFEDNLLTQTERLEGLLACGALAELQRVGHSFKGTAGYFELTELGEIARNLESACGSGDRAAAERTIHAWKELVAVLGVKCKQ
jgi:HPt (histidine-containing phosphotransfer) domain-containing protein